MEFQVHPRTTNGRSFRFVTDLDRILIGRGEVCDVRLPHPWVSFHHATLQRTPRGYELIDHGSLNGTWHSGRRVHAGEAARVSNGDRISVPGFLIDVRIAPGASTAVPTDAEEVGRSIYRALLRPDLAEETPRFEVHAGPLAGRQLALAGRDLPYTVGRDPACDWEIPDREASREHLVVASDGERVRVVDQGSKNGVRLNGRIVRDATLRDGDIVEVGRTRLVFRDPRGEALRLLSTETSEQGALDQAFESLERGEEARLTSEPPTPRTSGAPTVPAGRGSSTPPATESPAEMPRPSAPAEKGPTTEAAPKPGKATKAADPSVRDVADLLAAPPVAATVARREGRAGGAPDGADALIVALGIAVFLVCLVAIYMLLR